MSLNLTTSIFASDVSSANTPVEKGGGLHWMERPYSTRCCPQNRNHIKGTFYMTTQRYGRRSAVVLRLERASRAVLVNHGPTWPGEQRAGTPGQRKPVRGDVDVSSARGHLKENSRTYEQNFKTNEATYERLLTGGRKTHKCRQGPPHTPLSDGRDTDGLT